MTSLRRHTSDERGRGSTPHAIALMRTLGVVVAHEVGEGALQGRPVGEVAATEDHTPELLENRALLPFDEAVGPGIPRFGARVPDAALATSRIQRALELRPTIVDDAA